MHASTSSNGDENNFKQEWSSMESNSYENWDEIEMFFGYLVFGNLKLGNL